ncbi:MAG: protein translocase subunit SecD [Rhizomicrobium sp.]|jgi:SecD/SecF fusion protein
MLQFPTWYRIVTAIIVAAGILFALPNALPGWVVAKMPAWLPRNSVTLGLDLQGGSSILLEVGIDQVYKDQLVTLTGDIRVRLRKANIGYKNLETKTDQVSVQIIDPARYDDAKSILNDLNPAVGGSMLTVGQRAYDVTEPGGNAVVLKMTDPYKASTLQTTMSDSLETVRKRIDSLGTREPTITQEGDSRIVVQVPGLDDPSRLIKLLGKTGKMTFQLVDDSADIQQAARGVVPIGDELLQMQDKDRNGQSLPPMVVERRIIVNGVHLKVARPDFSSQSGLPDIQFSFDTVGAKEFGDATSANVGRKFAIVLDNEIITAPTIQSPILGGNGEIDGNFTVQETNDLATIIQSGALPAPLHVIDQATVGPSLGTDQVNEGKYSALAGLLLVCLFMILRYGLFGVFADVALVLNIVFLMAILTAFGATLTLPGIAGIVLTMGMAVDANVLIYERIREEHRNGRTIIASIDQGFQRAFTTIFDANFTHMIASLILFMLGSGPVRGFAVALGVGIVTSFYTSFNVTRLIVITWLKAARPKELTL